MGMYGFGVWGCVGLCRDSSGNRDIEGLRIKAITENQMEKRNMKWTLG